MQKISCPGCGAELNLLSPATVHLVCSYCKNTIIHDRDWKSFGRMADLPPEITPLQIGTKGYYGDESFELIGRQRIRWSDGYWTEWCALFPKGKMGFLAEAQGHWMMSFLSDTKLNPMQAKELRSGQVLNIPKIGEFRIVDAKTATCIGTEGELPYDPRLNVEILSFDATDDNARFLNVDVDKESGDNRLYVGKYVTFNDFKFKNLRKLDGW